MIYLKDTSHYEELIVKDRVISIARKMAEQGEGKYSKEFISYVCGLTEEGYEEVIKRATVMYCAKIFVKQYRIEFLQEKLELNEEEIKDLIKYKDEQKENDEEYLD